jgi:hypothetical protein
MIALLKKKHTQFAIAIGLALFGPFLLPPHVVGIYIPLGSFLFEGNVWRGEPDRFFYGAFFIELAVYSGLLYGFWRLIFNLVSRYDSDPDAR